MLPPGWFYPFVALFVIVMTLALTLQFAMLGAMFLLMRKLQGTAEKLIQDEVRPILDDAKPMVTDLRRQLHQLSETLTRVEESAEKHIAEADSLITGVTQRAQRHVERADDLITRGLERVEDAGHTVVRGVRWPFRVARALGSGVTAGASHLVRPRQRFPVREISAPAPPRELPEQVRRAA